MVNISSVQDQFNEALPLYKEAYDHFRQFYGIDEHANIARVLNNIGQTYPKLGNLTEAFDYLKKALQMRQKTLGINHPDTATTWVNLSLVHRANGNLNAALECAREGLIIRRSTLQPEHEDLQGAEEYIAQLEQEALSQNQE